MKITPLSTATPKISKQNPSFRNINVHIVDGGSHSTNMTHYAKAIMKNLGDEITILNHSVEVHKEHPDLKIISDLCRVLKNLNAAKTFKKGEYVIIPALASVPLLNLDDRIRDILGKKVNLTPQNVKSHRPLLLNLLENIYNNKYKTSIETQISYMDKLSLGLGDTFGIIHEINRMVENGIKVYVPAGHPESESVKWLAKQQGHKNMLYAHIDSGGWRYADYVSELFSKVRKEGWYDFNLLALSNADVVNIKNPKNIDYIYAGYDTCINNSARGTFNFYPIKNTFSGRILGYSFTDKSTNEYPYDEFPKNNDIYRLNKFVGDLLYTKLADNNERSTLRTYVRLEKDRVHLPDKLYPLSDVFKQREIDEKELNILGRYTDKYGQLIFDVNHSDEITFRKCNCEGSLRPSVVPMWGSCFAAITAAANDIKANIEKAKQTQKASYFIMKGDSDKANLFYDGAEYYYNKALDLIMPEKSRLECSDEGIEVYKKLLDVLRDSGKGSNAKDVADKLINLMAYKIKDLSTHDPQYINVQKEMSKLYKRLAIYCKFFWTEEAVKICNWAAEELNKNSAFGDKIVQKRADGDAYIGDLYNEAN